mmetsp:Transcript_31467/g.62357  ORF Transcript_31467/g.62357 Transcript_31467/m.62357 type:complete len:546 (-) Transcript_31467:39-1676(-)
MLKLIYLVDMKYKITRKNSDTMNLLKQISTVCLLTRVAFAQGQTLSDVTCGDSADKYSSFQQLPPFNIVLRPITEFLDEDTIKTFNSLTDEVLIEYMEGAVPEDLDITIVTESVQSLSEPNSSISINVVKEATFSGDCFGKSLFQYVQIDQVVLNILSTQEFTQKLVASFKNSDSSLKEISNILIYQDYQEGNIARYTIISATPDLNIENLNGNRNSLLTVVVIFISAMVVFGTIGTMFYTRTPTHPAMNSSVGNHSKRSSTVASSKSYPGSRDGRKNRAASPAFGCRRPTTFTPRRQKRMEQRTVSRSSRNSRGTPEDRQAAKNTGVRNIRSLSPRRVSGKPKDERSGRRSASPEKSSRYERRSWQNEDPSTDADDIYSDIQYTESRDSNYDIEEAMPDEMTSKRSETLYDEPRTRRLEYDNEYSAPKRNSPTSTDSRWSDSRKIKKTNKEPNTKGRLLNNLLGLEEQLSLGDLFLDGNQCGENDFWFFDLVNKIHPEKLEPFPKVKSWSFRMFQVTRSRAEGRSRPIVKGKRRPMEKVKKNRR